MYKINTSIQYNKEKITTNRTSNKENKNKRVNKAHVLITNKVL